VDVAEGRTVAVGFQLEVAPTHLTGLVVTATGERRRVEVGHDITVINVDSIMKHEPVTSVTDLLEGRVPGLVVQRTTGAPGDPARIDRKSTRLNSSHVKISYAVFCLKKKICPV